MKRFLAILVAMTFGLGVAHADILQNRVHNNLVPFSWSCATEQGIRDIISIDDELGLQWAQQTFNHAVTLGLCSIHNGAMVKVTRIIDKYEYANKSMGDRGTSYFVVFEYEGETRYSVIAQKSLDKFFPELPEA